MNFKCKKTEGITLIALVVTIVVLLILAGITIGMILGENGIIAKAQKAKELQRIAQIKEQVKIKMSELTADKIENARENITTKEVLEVTERDEIIVWKDVEEEKGITEDSYSVKFKKDETGKIIDVIVQKEHNLGLLLNLEIREEEEKLYVYISAIDLENGINQIEVQGKDIITYESAKKAVREKFEIGQELATYTVIAFNGKDEKIEKQITWIGEEPANLDLSITEQGNMYAKIKATATMNSGKYVTGIQKIELITENQCINFEEPLSLKQEAEFIIYENKTYKIRVTTGKGLITEQTISITELGKSLYDVSFQKNIDYLSLLDVYNKTKLTNTNEIKTAISQAEKQSNISFFHATKDNYANWTLYGKDTKKANISGYLEYKKYEVNYETEYESSGWGNPVALEEFRIYGYPGFEFSSKTGASLIGKESSATTNEPRYTKER